MTNTKLDKKSYDTNKRNNQVKKEQLGMSYGKARNDLNKLIMFKLLQETGKDICHQCGKKIEDSEHVSVEHMTPWLHSEDPIKLFFDLDNISFSHRKCNSSAARPPQTYSARTVSNASGYKGVQLNNAHRRHANSTQPKWEAVFQRNKVKTRLGRFHDPKDAAIAYDNYAIEQLGDKAITNKSMGLLD